MFERLEQETQTTKDLRDKNSSDPGFLSTPKKSKNGIQPNKSFRIHGYLRSPIKNSSKIPSNIQSIHQQKSPEFRARAL